MLQQHKRGMRRTKPICWLNSSAQLFSVISWPSAFQEYERKESDVLATTFTLIQKLQAQTYQPIPATECNNAATRFIQYVNYQKSKVATTDVTIPDPLWNINLEQDAQACIGYFFNMMVDLNNDNIIPDALTVNAKNISTIDEMQRFVRNNFAFATSDWINCKNKNECHIGFTEPRFMFDLALPANGQSTSLQKLIDDYLKPEPVTLLCCEHCNKKHDDTKKTQFTQLSDRYLMINLKRFAGR